MSLEQEAYNSMFKLKRSSGEVMEIFLRGGSVKEVIKIWGAMLLELTGAQLRHHCLGSDGEGRTLE